MQLHTSLLWLIPVWANFVSATHSKSSSTSTDEEKKVVDKIEVKEKGEVLVKEKGEVLPEDMVVIYLKACNKIVDEKKLSIVPKEAVPFKRFLSCTSACLYTALGEDLSNPPPMLGEPPFLLAIQDSKIPEHILDLADKRLILLAQLAKRMVFSKDCPFDYVHPQENLIARACKIDNFMNHYLFDHTGFEYALGVLPSFRYAHKVAGDGNCLYRSFLFGLVILYSKRSNSPRWEERMVIDAVLHNPAVYGTDPYITLGLDLISHVLMFAPFYDSGSWRTPLNDPCISDIMVYALRAIVGHHANTPEHRAFLTEDFDGYVAHKILTMGVWGGQLEVSCLAQAFNVLVAVTDLVGKRRVLTDDSIALEKLGDVELLFNGVHYDLLIA